MFSLWKETLPELPEPGSSSEVWRRAAAGVVATALGAAALVVILVLLIEL